MNNKTRTFNVLFNYCDENGQTHYDEKTEITIDNANLDDMLTEFANQITFMMRHYSAVSCDITYVMEIQQSTDTSVTEFNVGFSYQESNDGTTITTMDETQFDIKTSDFETMTAELMNLFYQFTLENKIQNYHIDYIEKAEN